VNQALRHCRIGCVASLLAASPLFAQAPRPLVDPAVMAQADGRVHTDRADPQLRYALLPAIFPSAHASNLLQLRNGDLLCVWFSGSWEGNSDVAIVLSRLDRGSQQWSRPILIDHRPGESFQNPVLFEAPDGVLHLYHTTQPATGGEAEARVLTAESHDGGHTWTAPRQLFAQAGAFTRHPVVVLPDGAWLLPLTVMTSEGIGVGAETNYSSSGNPPASRTPSPSPPSSPRKTPKTPSPTPPPATIPAPPQTRVPRVPQGTRAQPNHPPHPPAQSRNPDRIRRHRFLSPAPP
jgi:hypothetical protein